jgi:hypothetical protein
MRSVPARYPTNGQAWPAEMRADQTAAFFDFDTTGKLFQAIARGEAPRPTSTRMHRGKKAPVWARVVCEEFISERHDLSGEAASFLSVGEVEFA